MGNTDSKLNPVYKHHLSLLLSKDNINLFQENITQQQVYDLLYLKWENKNNVNTIINIQSNIFNSFYTDLVNNNNTAAIINKSILQKIFQQNITNYENLLRFVIINFILHSKYIQLNQSIDNIAIQTTLTNCINLLINLLPIYYSSSLSHNNNNNKKTDFIWNCQSFQNVLNADINFLTHSIIDNDKSLTPPIPLGQLITDNLLNLSFVNGWSIYRTTKDTESVPNGVWENGIGTKDNFSLRQYPHLDSNRLLCLKLWLSLFANELYSNNNNENKNNNPFLSKFILTKSNDPTFKRLVLSIINITSVFGNNFKSNLSKNNYYKDANHLNQLKNLDDNVITDNKILIQLKMKLISTGIQFINTILSHPTIATQDSSLIKDFISSLFVNEFDLKLFLSSFTKIFKYPIDKCIEMELNPLNFNKSLNSTSNDSSISNNNKQNNNNQQIYNNTKQNNQNNNNISTLPDIPEILIQLLLLIKSMLQFNTKFKSYFIEKFGNKFIIFNIYYIKYYSKFSKYKSNLIPLCFVLTSLTLNDELTLSKLLQTFSINYYTNKLPNFFKLSNLELNNINSLTYRDFIIIHLSNWNIKLIKQNIIPNNFTFEIFYNILSINTDDNMLSYNAALSLLNLFAKMSNKAYLSSFGNNEINVKGSQYLKSIQSLSLPSWKLDQLALMIRTILNFIIFHYNASKNLIFLLIRHQNLFFQIKDSLTFISKIIFNNPSKLNDYMFNNLQNIQTFTKIEYMIQLNQHDLINNNNNNMSNEKMGCCNPINNNNSNSDDSSDSDESFTSNNQTLIFNKKIPNSSDSEIGSTTTNNTTNDSINTNKSKTNNNNSTDNDENKNVKKKLSIWEHSDYNYDLFFHDEYIYTIFKRKWPLGLNENYKLKSLQNLTIDPTNNTYWSGYQDFKLLTKLIKLFVLEFPEIPNTKNNSEFTILLKKFDVFKPKLDEKIKNQLPIHFTDMNLSDGIRISISDNNFKEWIYKLCWTDIFNAHSYPYQHEPDAIDDSNVNKPINKVTEATPQNKRLSDVASMESAAINSNNGNNRVSVSSSPLLPSLERWSSTNSNLSRTQSNSSSILNFFSPDSINHDNDNITPNNNTPKHQPSTSASPSSGLFKFSWSNFHKGDEETTTSIIKEEIDDNDDEIQDNNSKKMNFPIDLYKIPSDEKLVRDNLWVNTNIKLFNVKKEEKEEVSFLDMTSSLLKKFKFSNVIDTSYEDDASYISSNNEPLTRPIRRLF